MTEKRKKLMTLVEAQAEWCLNHILTFEIGGCREDNLCRLKHSVTDYLGYDVTCDCIQDAGYTRNYAIKLVEDEAFSHWIDIMFKMTKTFDRVMEEWLKAIKE